MADGSLPEDESPPAEESQPEKDPPSGGGDGAAGFVREVAAGLLLAAFAAFLLFGLSGVWPPMVAVESESMEPHLYRGDLVFVAEEHRFGSPAAVAGTGVVPARVGDDVGHPSLGGSGDVIVYYPDGRDRSTPIIHRAQFWVNESENWYAKANPAYVRGENCEAVPNCPAPHAGFVTKGDNNGQYDQVAGVSEPVRPSWIRGTAEYKVPYLGRVRLAFGQLGSGATVDIVSGGVDVAQTSTTSTKATSIDAVRSNWTSAEPRTPTTA